MRFRNFVAVAVAVIGATTLTLRATGSDQNNDHEQIKAAVLDYVNSIYEVKPELLDRSVSPNLVKFGYWFHTDKGEWEAMSMTFDQLKDLAGHWNADGSVPADAPKKIVVHDVRDRTASASLDAIWGMDHIQLIKQDGKWMILQVLWQSTPETQSH